MKYITYQHTHTGCVCSSVSADAHLAELFVQGGGPGLGCCVTLGAEHLLVPVDEVAVAQPDHLHTDTHTEGTKGHDHNSKVHLDNKERTQK